MAITPRDIIILSDAAELDDYEEEDEPAAAADESETE